MQMGKPFRKLSRHHGQNHRADKKWQCAKQEGISSLVSVHQTDRLDSNLEKLRVKKQKCLALFDLPFKKNTIWKKCFLPEQNWNQIIPDQHNSERLDFHHKICCPARKKRPRLLPLDTAKSQNQSVYTVPDAAVVFEGAGCLLTFQTELYRTWIVFLLKEAESSFNVISKNTKFSMQFHKKYIKNWIKLHFNNLYVKINFVLEQKKR